MDEPFSALDAQTKMHLQGELLAAVRGMDTTAMIITHDLTCAKTTGDRVAMLLDGKFERVGTFDEVLPTPTSGCSNFIITILYTE